MKIILILSLIIYFCNVTYFLASAGNEIKYDKSKNVLNIYNPNKIWFNEKFLCIALPEFIDSSSEYVFSKKWGSKGFENGQFNNPMGITVDLEGNIYVLDCLNHRIEKFDSDGNFITVSKEYEYYTGMLTGTFGRAITATQEGMLYVVNGHIETFDSNCAHLFTFKYESGCAGSPVEDDFSFIPMGPAMGVAIDQNDTIYVSDPCNHRILRFGKTEDPLSLDSLKDSIWKFNENDDKYFDYPTEYYTLNYWKVNTDLEDYC